MRWRRQPGRRDEIARELLSHIEQEAKEREADGLSPEDARHTARRALGNLGLIGEATGEVWSRGSLERLAQDFRYAIRMIRRSPGFTAIAVVTLALLLLVAVLAAYVPARRASLVDPLIALRHE